MAIKILYISPENTVGTLTLWKMEHESRGNYCRTVTFFKSPKNFEEDICLNLPFDFTGSKMSSFRNMLYKYYRGREGYFKPKNGYPPTWHPEGWLDKMFFKFKDWLWKPIIEKAIEDFDLYNFDVIHYESGSDFFKNEVFVKEIHRRGKKVIAHYHGEDLRSSGVMPFLDSVANLNLTNEVDLLNKHPNINYLFLPYDTSKLPAKNTLSNKIVVSHAPTNRFYKGSNFIISVCEKLEKEKLIQFDLIEDLPHSVALDRKYKSDIFIDQIGDRGGWGYGMNSVESLSMGICTLTEINDQYHNFIPDHPFVNINQHNLEKTLRNLCQNKQIITKKGQDGRRWVVDHHDIKQVAEKLYTYYRMIGLPV